jgi:quercetin dioxygenase-like cupin family protein
MPMPSGQLQARAAAVLAATLFCLHPALADGYRVVQPSQLEFRPVDPSVPNGPEMALLAEQTTGAPPRAYRFRLRAGMVGPLHFHSEHEFATVLSGRIRMAFGKNADEASAHVLTAGSFIFLPAGEYHRTWADEDSVLDVFSVEPATKQMDHERHKH